MREVYTTKQKIAVTPFLGRTELSHDFPAVGVET